MSEAYKAYSFLHENIPSWMTSLEEIRKKIVARETEASRIAVPVVPVPKKTGSTETLKDNNNVNTNSHLELASAPQPEDTSPAGARRQQQALLAKRKRKTTSVLSDQPSGPSKYRSRNMIVVWYDSEVQKAFETLVRNIGAGRNYLRKGSMAAKLEALSSEMAAEDADDNGDYADPVLAKIGYRPSLGLGHYRTSQSRGGFGLTEQKGGQTQFDIADKALEKAQSFCEKGAHQFLRDGDCTVELDGCREAFQEVSKLSETEAAKYKVKDEAEKQRKQQEEERKRQQEAEEEKRRSAHQAHLPPASLAPANGLLEVDDASSDEEELSLAALPPIRMTSRMARV